MLDKTSEKMRENIKFLCKNLKIKMKIRYEECRMRLSEELHFPIPFENIHRII